MLKNLTLRPKLIGSYALLALVATLLAYFGVQLAFRDIVTHIIPTLQVMKQAGELVGFVRGTTLEFVVGGGKETSAANFNEKTDELNVLLEQIKSDLAQAHNATEKESFEQLTQVAEQTIVVGQETIQSYQQTLQYLKELDTLETEANLVFDEAIEITQAEIKRNFQEGDLTELEQDALPTRDYLDQFIEAIKIFNLEAIEFVGTGEEATWQGVLAAEANLEEAQVKLALLLEADEPDEKDLLVSLDNIEERFQLKTKEVFESHRRTLSWLAEMEQLGRELANVTDKINLQLEEEISESVTVTTRNILIASGVVLLLAILLGVFITNSIVRPIQQLVDVTRQIGAGDIAIRAKVTTADEIGNLAQTFNGMTAQLGELIDTLEYRVAARTQQLETVVSISQRLTTILDLGDLLYQVVTITKETFNYYHVHIYLLDERHEALNLTEGYGQPGVEMKRRGHNIPLTAPKSLVARAAREGRIVTVENVRLNPDWLPNPLLPETYSEMAVPVMLGPEVVGVLDVQSEIVGGLTVEDQTALQALSNQVAAAVHNAQLFSETQMALNEAQKLQHLYTSQTWERFGAARATTDYEFRQSIISSLQEVTTPEAEAALQRGQTVIVGAPTMVLKSENLGQPAPIATASTANPSALATPLKLHNKVIGVLGLHDENPNRRWTEDEIALIEAVSEQMSQAIENARLFEETQRSAWRDQMVSESTAKVWLSAEIEEVMRAAVAQLGDKLRASEVVIRLGTAAELTQNQ